MTTKTYQIYLVDDDKDFREATCEYLQEEGLSTRAFSNGRPRGLLHRLCPLL